MYESEKASEVYPQTHKGWADRVTQNCLVPDTVAPTDPIVVGSEAEVSLFLGAT